MEFNIISIIWILLSFSIPVYVFFKYCYSYWKIRGVPYLEPHLLYGNLKGVGTKIHFKDLLNSIYGKFKGQGSFAGGYFFNSPFLVITDLDFVKQVLVRDFQCFQDRKQYYDERYDPLSAHMFNLDGEKWKIIRKKLSPTFTAAKMRRIFPIAQNVSDRMVKVLEGLLVKSDIVEVKDLLSRYTTDIIGIGIFGLKCNSLENQDDQFRSKGLRVVNFPRHGEIVRLLMNAFPNLARSFAMKIEHDDVTEFFMKVVGRTIEYRECNGIKCNDFMDLLIELKNAGSLEGSSVKIGKLSIREIVSQAFLFYIAGFESSASTVAFCLYSLALNENIQDRVRKEICEKIEENSGKITYEAVFEMNYLQRVVDETLRMYPPDVALLRKAVKDYRLPKSDLVIEKDTMVIIPTYAIHHDPEVYPNPEVFNPDNFLPESIQSRHPTTFLTFGKGPRACLGIRFGRMMVYMGLITLLMNFRFKPSHMTSNPIKFDPNIEVLTSMNDINLVVEKL